MGDASGPKPLISKRARPGRGLAALARRVVKLETDVKSIADTHVVLLADHAERQQFRKKIDDAIKLGKKWAWAILTAIVASNLLEDKIGVFLGSILATIKDGGL